MPVSKIMKVAAVVPLLLGTSAVLSAVPALRSTFASSWGPACKAWNGTQPSTPQASVIGIATLRSCGMVATGDVLGADNFTTLAVQSDGTTWRQRTAPTPGESSSLNSVAVISDTEGWAAGTYASGHVTHALIERWNGTSWVRQGVPEPGGPKRSTSLFAVAASSASDAWAVGNYRAPDGHLRTLVVHWNGRVWRQMVSPNPGGARRDDRLTSVASISADDAWAVGYYRDAGSARRVLVLHWNGGSWLPARVPSLGRSGGSMLFGVTAISARDVWAVGYLIQRVPRTLVLHWDGTSWARVPTPDPAASGDILSGVAGTSASNIWAVGHSKISAVRSASLILHWNGDNWTQMPSPTPDPGDSALLIGVATSSTGNAWAVGGYRTPNGYAQGFFLHWNGRSWRA
jgi:hypothetical protein